jgi:hypothetical protein
VKAAPYSASYAGAKHAIHVSFCALNWTKCLLNNEDQAVRKQ